METEYRLIRDPEKGWVIADESGLEISTDVAHPIVEVLKARYPKPIYLYIGIGAENNLYKIGVSNNVYRREIELGILIVHSIPCSRSTVYELERCLHKFLKVLGLHVHGEWFHLHVGEDDFREKLSTLKTEADVWRWMRAIRGQYSSFELLDYGHQNGRTFREAFLQYEVQKLNARLSADDRAGKE